MSRPSRAFLMLALATGGVARANHQASAILTVENQLAERVSVYVDKTYVGGMAGRSRVSFEVKPGRAEVIVKDAHGRVVANESDVLTPSHVETIVVRPTQGVVHAENRTVETGTVWIDGVRRAELDPGEGLDLHLAVGDHRVEFRIEEHVVLARQVALDGYREKSFLVDVALEGTLVVRNPLPIEVVLVSVGSTPRMLEPYTSTVYRDVPVGSVAVAVTRASGESIATLRPGVTAFDTTRVDVPVPKQGFVDVRADDWRTLTLTIDGRSERQLEHEARIQLSVGEHRLAVRTSSGRIVLSQTVRVDPFDVVRLRVDTNPALSDGRDHHDDWGHDAGDRHDDPFDGDRDRGGSHDAYGRQ
jgi:hypothetical protein